MNRLQWFKVSPLDRTSLRMLSDVLLKNPYSKDNRVGFAIESVRAEVITGRFIERVEFKEVIVDPFGAETTIERVRYDTTEFAIFSDIELIECANAGRNIKNCLNEIAKATNFKVAISKVKIPLQELAKALRSGAKGLVVTKAVADDIQLGDGVWGQLHASGVIDIRKPLQQFIGGREYQLNRARIVLEVNDEQLTIEASHGGTVSSVAPIGAKFRLILRKNVANLAEAAD